MPPQAVNAAAVEAPPAAQLDWETLAAEMDSKSPLEIMDHVRKFGCLFLLYLRAAVQAGNMCFVHHLEIMHHVSLCACLCIM